MSAVIPMMIETIMLSSLTGFVIKSPDKTKTIPTANDAFPSFVTNSFTLSHPSLIIYLRITQKQMIALPIIFKTAKKIRMLCDLLRIIRVLYATWFCP